MIAALLLQLRLLPAFFGVCEPWCSNSCRELEGDIIAECGGCTSDSACAPDADGFPSPPSPPLTVHYSDEKVISTSFEANVPFLCGDMPDWMRDSVRGSIEPAEQEKYSRNPDQPCRATVDMPAEPPTFEVEAKPIPRARGLNASAFYWNFARPGVPVILEGALESDVPLATRAQALIHCCKEDYERGKANFEGQKRDRCDMYTDWCESGPQLCGQHPPHKCKFAAGEELTAALPPALEALFSFPSPLPSAQQITARFSSPYVFWSKPGDTFGHAGHYDMLCVGTFSMQYQGAKKWSVWAPWDVTMADGAPVRAHARYEGAVGAGDLLFYPPAWFHATSVLPGAESITVAADIDLVPYYAKMGDNPLRSPFGYSACAEGPFGYHARSAIWDAALRGAGASVQAPTGEPALLPDEL